MRLKRILCLLLALSVVYSSVSWAIIPLAAAPTLTTAGLWIVRTIGAQSIRVKAAEFSLAVNGAFLTALAWDSLSKPSPSTQDTSTKPLEIEIWSYPKPDATRQNPDKNKWDDAPANQRDPVPKQSYPITAGSQTMPSNYPAVVQAIGGAGSGTFTRYSGSNPTHTSEVTVTTSGDPSKTASWQGGVTVNGQSGYYYVYDSVTPITCGAGYTRSGNDCIIIQAQAEQIMKPAKKVPCEVLRNADGSWVTDNKNPECVNLAQKMYVSDKKLTITRVSGSDYDEIESNPDGSMTIRQRGGGANRDIKTGPYNSAADGWPIESITDNPGSPSQTTTTSGPGTTTGGTGGTGTGTSGGGSCGGSGQVPCSIDDSGFNGKADSLNGKADAAISKLDDREKQIKDTDDKGTFGIEKDWIPNLKPGPSVSCQPLNWSPAISHGPLSGLTGSIDVQWCDKVDIFREYLGWLFGVSTVIGIALLFFGSNRPGGGKD